jgi:hypothetical protein
MAFGVHFTTRGVVRRPFSRVSDQLGPQDDHFSGC